ncbi:MAG: cation transporter [Aquabacterium sp.]|jgi:copper chaperone|uniref:heavy-metal-associated domain-containing protein n=1 Tax=Aquabacterium sp. TaxID=1872578 RepID=UPI003BB09867
MSTTTPQTLQLSVKGMSCQHCVKSVTNAVQALDPQATVQVDLAQGRVSVNSVLTADAVTKAISEEGYEAQAA